MYKVRSVIEKHHKRYTVKKNVIIKLFIYLQHYFMVLLIFFNFWAKLFSVYNKQI